MVKCLSILFLFATHAFAGGDLVNNGGGLAEKNVYYAYKNLETYIRSCFESPFCKITEDQKLILTKISEAMPKEQSNVNQIVFTSEAKNPGTFILDGQVRIAKTGDLVSSPIYFNTDLIYSKDKLGHFQAMTIPEAVAVLIHEMGHHHGHFSHEELDLLGVTVSLYLQRTLISTPMIPWESDISATVYNPSNVTAFPELLLYVGNDIIDLSKMYRQTVQCNVLSLPVPILPVPDIVLIKEAPMGSTLSNVHWQKIKDRDNTMDIEIAGNISNMCRLKSEERILNNSFKFSLKFKIRKKQNVWVYQSGSADMKQVSSAWYKFIKLP